MVGEFSRFLATLLTVIFCALGAGLLAEMAAVGVPASGGAIGSR